MAYVRSTSETPGWQKCIKSLDSAIAKITIMKARVEDMQPALNDIAQEFALMEAQRFRNNGVSSEFGTKKWPELEESTIKRRQYDDKSNHGSEALDARGYLANAASAPKFEFFGKNSIALIINPSGKGRPSSYTRGHDYGFYQQNSKKYNRHNKDFEFVTITPEFLGFAKIIVERYILGGVATKSNAEKAKIPSDHASGDIAKGIRERRARKVRQNRELKKSLDKRAPEYISYGKHMQILKPGKTAAKHQEELVASKSIENMSRAEFQQFRIESRKAVNSALRQIDKSKVEKQLGQYLNGDPHMRKP